MIVDSSALVAIILKEAGWEILENTLVGSSENLISPVNRMEVFMRLESIDGEWLVSKFEALSTTLRLTTVLLDEAQLGLAQDAFQRFGKGRHKAALNMGDCFAYALAKAKGQPILFKGSDFSHTDLESAV
ncbi:MAG: type II toxin-antitoxin system VapC family toxin [Rhizobiaceae bacterium]